MEIAPLIFSAFYSPVEIAGLEAVMGDNSEPIDPSRAHAVVLAGHGDLRGMPFFLVRNSWGIGWGREGHAWFPVTYLARRFVGAFVIYHGVSDAVQPNANSAYSRLRVG